MIKRFFYLILDIYALTIKVFIVKFRDFDHYLELKEYNTFLNVYKRKNFERFLNYLNEYCEPVIFSTGKACYVDLIMVNKI